MAFTCFPTKKIYISKARQGREDSGTLTHCQDVRNATTTSENTRQFLEKSHVHFLYDPNISLLDLPKENESVCLYADFYMNVYIRLICNSQKL